MDSRQMQSLKDLQVELIKLGIDLETEELEDMIDSGVHLSHLLGNQVQVTVGQDPKWALGFIYLYDVDEEYSEGSVYLISTEPSEDDVPEWLRPNDSWLKDL